MTPEAYDAWYQTARGRWIGETEFDLLLARLRPQPGESLLDVGCGTGYFTRNLARVAQRVTGIDPDAAAIDYARRHAAADERYLIGDARALPFPDKHFDYAVAMTSLCFVPEEVQALSEMVRVARRTVVLGLLNRRSLLYRQKGRHGGQGAYRGARWHTPRDIRRLFSQAGLSTVTLRSAVFLPDGGVIARILEAVVPNHVLCGGLLLALTTSSCEREGR